MASDKKSVSTPDAAPAPDSTAIRSDPTKLSTYSSSEGRPADLEKIFLDPTTTHDLPSADSRKNPTPVDTNTASYPTLNPIAIFSDSLKEFDLAFPLFSTTPYQMVFIKEHLQEAYSEYKYTVTALIKLILCIHTTGIQDIMDLLQSPQSPPALTPKNIN